MALKENTSSTSLLTPEQLRKWRNERDRVARKEAIVRERYNAEMQALKAKRTKLEKLINAGEAFLEIEVDSPVEQFELEEGMPILMEKESVEIKPQESTGYPRRGRGKTWTATILKIVRNANERMSYDEVKDELRKTHLGETLNRTEKGFYGALKKLDDRGDLIRHKGWVFTPKVYHEFMQKVAAGRAVDEPTRTFTHKSSPNGIAVERFLKKHPEGVTAAEIVKDLLNNPPPELRITKNKNSIYNLLTRQKKNGELIMRDDKYFLPRKKDETPGSEEPDASNNQGSNGNGTLLSSSGRGSHSLAALPGAIPADLGQ